jgi:hypothetical protein
MANAPKRAYHRVISLSLLDRLLDPIATNLELLEQHVDQLLGLILLYAQFVTERPRTLTIDNAEYHGLDALTLIIRDLLRILAVEEVVVDPMNVDGFELLSPNPYGPSKD